MGTGLSTNTVRQSIISDPKQAQELGALFAGERTTTTTTRQLGRFEVDGQRNGVLYDNQNGGDVARNMAGQITMTPGSVYEVNASGEIDKGSWFGGNVGPGDAQKDREGTRLQVAITRDGEVLQRLDYTPGMRVQCDVPGAQLGFYFADGDLSDNSGRFDVNVRETSVTKTETNVAINAANADGVDAAAVRAARELDAAPAAASLPLPDRDLGMIPAGKGIAVDAETRQIGTPDGYRFAFDQNELRVYLPGRGGDEAAATTFRGRQVTEGDGTTWTAESGNYFLPNGAMFQLEYDGDRIKRFTMANGDSRVRVTDIDKDPQMYAVEGGGYEWRRNQVEDNVGARSYLMGGYNDRVDDQDVTWNMVRNGQNLGRMEGDDVVGAPYTVDPQLRGELGTEQYERMLRAAIEDQRSTIAGRSEAAGYPQDVARMIADYMLGQSGAYEASAQQLAASRNAREYGAGGGGIDQRALLEQLWLRQMLGGLPANGQGGWNDSYGALSRLQQQLMLQEQMRGALDMGRYNSLGQPGGMDPMLLAALQQRESAFADEPQSSGGGAAASMATMARTLGVARATNMARLAREAGVTTARPRFNMNQAARTTARGTGEVLEAVRGADGVYRVVPRSAAETTAALRGTRALPGSTSTALVRSEGRALANTERALAQGVERGAVRGAGSSLARGLGKVAVPVAIAMDAIDLGSSIQADRDRGDGKMTETKGAVGRIGGGWGGALAGAAIGQAVIPIPVVGALIGAGVGAIGGSWLGEKIASWF